MLEHAKWFVDWQQYPTDYALLLSPRMLLAVAAAAVVIGVAWWVHRNIAEPAVLGIFDRFVRWGPFFIGTHAGVPLVVAALTGRLFAPHLFVEDRQFGSGVLLFEGAVGALLVLGLLARYAAFGLAFLGPLSASAFGWEGIVEQAHFLGIAVFIGMLGRGPLSLDRIVPGRPGTPPVDAPIWAVTMLRVLAGFAVAFSALTEKILNPALGAALVASRPEVNFARGLGVAEFVIGAWIASGQVTRLAILLAWLPFNATLLLFGWDELLGHLPIFGIMFMLLVASEADAWHVRRTLRHEAQAA